VYLQPHLSLPPRGEPDYLIRSNRLFRLPSAPHTQADPFVFSRAGCLYLFFETQVADDFGKIEAAELSGSNIRRLGAVLSEPFHLSYPAVFGDEDRIYMLPESQGAGEMRLYRFDRFPDGPQFLRTLLPGQYADPSPVRVDGIWYIFATGPRGLELYFTEDLESGGLAAHPASPITNDSRYKRCGGMPFELDGRLVRPAQDCTARYGENLSLLAIRELSPTSYREELLTSGLLANDQPWNSSGGHHVSLCRTASGFAVAVDGQSPDALHHKFLKRAWMAATGRKRRLD